MHKADIDKLEHILSYQDHYQKLLRLREIELEYKPEEPEGKVINQNAQDQRTIKSGSTQSTVELSVAKKHSDLQYQTLYSIVVNTPKFVSKLTRLEQIIYQYRYQSKDILTYEWEDIALELDKVAQEKGKSIGKTTTLKLRNRMLERLAHEIGYTLM